MAGAVLVTLRSALVCTGGPGVAGSGGTPSGSEGVLALAPLSMRVPAGTSAATCTVSRIGVLPTATSDRRQVTVCPIALHTAGEEETKVSCGSSTSTPRTSCASDGPALVTVMV